MLQRVHVSLFSIALILGLSGCGTGGEQGGVGNKVLTDFGLRKPAEGAQSGTDIVYQKLPEVGKQEIERLNLQERRGTVKFKQDGLHGTYVKRVKKYENAYPVDASALSTNSQSTTLAGYTGTVEYSYRIFESAPKTSSTEAEASDADVPTDEQGRETYRYTFGPTGTWDGSKGQRTKADNTAR